MLVDIDDKSLVKVSYLMHLVLVQKMIHELSENFGGLSLSINFGNQLYKQFLYSYMLWLISPALMLCPAWCPKWIL